METGGSQAGGLADRSSQALPKCSKALSLSSWSFPVLLVTVPSSLPLYSVKFFNLHCPPGRAILSRVVLILWCCFLIKAVVQFFFFWHLQHPRVFLISCCYMSIIDQGCPSGVCMLHLYAQPDESHNSDPKENMIPLKDTNPNILPPNML